MVTTADKQRVADQYKDILTAINLFGDGAMLQDQLQQILISTGRYSRKASVVDALGKLEKCEIIKKVTPKQYRSQFILLKKFGIMFLRGKENSQQVSALKQISNAKYDRMVFRAEIFIQRYLVNKQRTLEEVIALMEQYQCSILQNKEQALEYMQIHAGKHLKNKEYQHQLELLKIARKQSKANLDQSKDKKIKDIVVPAEVSVFTKAFRKGLIILGVTDTGILYGYTGSTTIKALAEAFLVAEELTRIICGTDNILIKIYTNEGTSIFLDDKIKNRHINNRTKELSKYTAFQQELIRQGVSTTLAENIDEKQIKAIAINTDKYRTSDK